MTFGLCLQGPLLSAIQLNMRKPSIFFKGDMQSSINLIFHQCVVPENIHTPSPPYTHTNTEGNYLLSERLFRPPTPLGFPWMWHLEPPTPRKFRF